MTLLLSGFRNAGSTRNGEVASSTLDLSLGFPSDALVTHATYPDARRDNAAETNATGLARESTEDAQPMMIDPFDGDDEWEKIRDDEATVEHTPTHPKFPSNLRHERRSRDESVVAHSFRLRLNTSYPSSTEIPQGLSVSWQDLRKIRLEVVRSRVKLRESRALLHMQKGKLDQEEARLLPLLRAASSDVTMDQLQGIINQLHLLVESRELLRPDEEALNYLEEQLIAQDAALTELESKLYDNDSPPLSPEFPAGVLDFRDVQTNRLSSPLSSRSSLNDPVPENQEYERCLKEVDSLRERVMDLQNEHDQLLRQRDKRTRLGRTLDQHSLEAIRRFEDDFKSLSLQLDKAEDNLMVAEASRITRQRVLDVRDLSATKSDPGPEQLSVPSPRSSDLALLGGGSFHEDAEKTTKLIETEGGPLSTLVTTLLRPEDEQTPIFRMPSASTNGQTINMARFINQWILHQLRHSPEEAVRFEQSLAECGISLEIESLAELVLARWFDDGSEEEFIVRVEAGDHTFAGSMARLNGVSQILNDKAQSQGLRPSPQGSQRPSRRNSGRLAKTEADSLV